jgi:hypothetical protein
MSIREKHIPEDVYDAMREDWRWPDHADLTKGSLAYVLQLAIEHGLVSPPCWEVLGDDYRISMVFKRKESAERWKASDNGFDKTEVRHWKGQTE